MPISESITAREATIRTAVMNQLLTGTLDATTGTPLSAQSLGFLYTNPDNTQDMVELRLIVRRRIDGVSPKSMLEQEQEMYAARIAKKEQREADKAAKVAEALAKRKENAHEN